MQTVPWNSTKENVYHDNSNCTLGKNIERKDIRTGTGGKPICAE
jgi:hypothetical protein